MATSQRIMPRLRGMQRRSMPDQSGLRVLPRPSLRDATSTWCRSMVSAHYPLRVAGGRRSGCEVHVFTFGYFSIVVTE